MMNVAKDVKKAAYKYAFTRTWVPPYAMDEIMVVAEEAFEAGADWVRNEEVADLKQKIQAGLAVMEFLEDDGDKAKALEAARELLLEALKL